MDQTLSLSQHPPQASPRPAQNPAAIASPPGPAGEEEPESPGRSPRQFASPGVTADPLAEAIAVVSGVILALTAVVVPLGLVLSESRHPSFSQSVRAGW